MTIPQLIKILACPKCHGVLEEAGADSLVCPACRLSYPVKEGIPVMLVEEARPLA